MLNISFSSSKPQIVEGTEQKYDTPEVISAQHIEIPSRWLGCRGTYHVVTRNISVVGTVEVKKYSSIQRVRYGTAKYNGWTVIVLEDSTNWHAIDKK